MVGAREGRRGKGARERGSERVVEGKGGREGGGRDGEGREGGRDGGSVVGGAHMRTHA